MAYTRVNWQNSPSTATPMSAANLNNMDAYIATLDTLVAGKASTAGDTFTGDVVLQTTLSAADKEVLRFTATDGKTFAVIMRYSNNKLVFRNITDSVDMLELGPTAGTLTANGQKVWTAANDGSGSGLDADTVDGLNSSGFVQCPSGLFHMYTSSTTPAAGLGVDGDVCVVF